MKLTKSQLKQIIKEELAKVAEKKKPFPDLTGDGKVTQADILKGRGVIDEDETSYEKEYGYVQEDPSLIDDTAALAQFLLAIDPKKLQDALSQAGLKIVSAEEAGATDIEEAKKK